MLDRNTTVFMKRLAINIKRPPISRHSPSLSPSYFFPALPIQLKLPATPFDGELISDIFELPLVARTEITRERVPLVACLELPFVPPVAGDGVPFFGGCLGLPVAGDSFLKVVGDSGRVVTFGVG